MIKLPVVVAIRFFVFCACCSSVALAAVSLTVTPASVSNTFSGNIVISISGLTNRESVILERYLDLNNNGVVDTNEPMTQHVLLTDGLAASVAGVRNINVPGDEDSKTNGTITVNLPFTAAPEADRIIGSFRFRLSSPTSRFTALEKPFAVTQTPLSQSVTGTVFATGLPFTNAIVTLSSHEQGFVCGAVADAAGHYALSALPGVYQISAFKPGASQVGNQVDVSLSASNTVTLNLTNSASTRTLSGHLKSTSGAGIPGVQVFLTSSKGQAMAAFSDKSGNFSIPVNPDQWSIAPSAIGLSKLGYMTLAANATVDTTGTNATTALSVPGVTSLIYGTLSSATGVGIPAVRISASDSTHKGTGVTDTNGNYVIGVADGYWPCQPEVPSLKQAGFLGQTAYAFLMGNDVSRQDFQVQPITARLLGQVVQDNGNPVRGLAITALSYGEFASSAVTDGNGDYDMSVCGDTWTLFLDTADLASRGLIAPMLLPYTIDNGQTNMLSQIVVRHITGTITGSVKDINGVGVNAGQMSAWTAVGEIAFTVYGNTDASGNYTIGVFDGPWTVGTGDLTLMGYTTPANQQTSVNCSTNHINFIAKPLPPLVLNACDLPDAGVGKPYSFQLTASGGAPPYLWMLTDGSLPSGISFGDGIIAPPGLVFGTPTKSTNSTFTVEVQDNLGGVTSTTYSLHILPAALAIQFHPGTASIEVHLTGETNRSFVLEYTTRLPGTWTPITTNELTEGAITIPNLAATNSTIFYRARVQ